MAVVDPLVKTLQRTTVRGPASQCLERKGRAKTGGSLIPVHEATSEETSQMLPWNLRDHWLSGTSALKGDFKNTEVQVISSSLNLQSQGAHLVCNRHSVKTLAKRRRVDGRATVTSTRTQVPNPASDFDGQRGFLHEAYSAR